jgi:hypothetical protein
MTDRELLELAAKAAGIKIDKSEFNGGARGNTGFDTLGNAILDWSEMKRWNPLTDDGDALRLAVKLDISVYKGFAYTPTGKFFNCIGMTTQTAATRCAIVRAAAEIGKEME